MKKKRCVMCSRMLPVRKVKQGPTRRHWDWTCRDEASCKRTFFDRAAWGSRRNCGDTNPYIRWLGGYWGRRHQRSAPHTGLAIGEEYA